MAARSLLSSSTLRVNIRQAWPIHQSYKPFKTPNLSLTKTLQRMQSSSASISSKKKGEPEYDIVIVGGGIVGAATARELILRHPNLTFAILEKEKDYAIHQSGNNSGVIHAGIYYTPGSLKAKLCVEGMHLSYKFCDEHKVPYKKVGKLIVARNSVEVKRLHDLFERGKKNNVPDMELIDGSRIKEFEPNCVGVKAIWSPHTGIVDWGLVTKHYGKHFEQAGGKVHFNFEVKGFHIASESQGSSASHHPVRIVDKRGQAVRCSYVLTCGGLQSDRLAEMSGCSREPRIVPFRGEYLLLKPEKQNLVRGNIYPVPDPRFPFLGVHFTPRMDGSVWLGPNAILAFKREGYSWGDIDVGDLWDAIRFRGFQKLAFKFMGFGTKEMIRSWFTSLQISELKSFVPQLTSSDVTRGPAGVRAQAMDGNGNLVDDFVFDVSEKAGDVGKRVLHCRNAPSPAATSSLAIAKMVADKVEQQFQLH